MDNPVPSLNYFVQDERFNPTQSENTEQAEDL